MSVENLLFIVVGASGAIGGAACRQLREAGARVMGAGRNREKGIAFASEIGIEWIDCDATDAGQVAALFAAANGPLAGAVNCAGSLLLKPAHITTDAEWQATIAANLTTSFNVLRQAAKAMQAGGGSLVLVSSAAARTGLANHEAIAAAKAGVIGLTLAAAASYAPRQMRVNCVAPGLVDTPLTSRITSNEASLKASTAMHALGRPGKADEVARAITWLLDPEQSWITGQVLGVDGGLGSVRPR